MPPFSFNAKGKPYTSRKQGAGRYMSRVSTGRNTAISTARSRGPRLASYAQVANVVRGLGVRPELKSLDKSNAVDFALTNPAANYFNMIQEGSGFWNRIGRKITMKTVHLRGNINLTTVPITAALTNEMVRYIIFYDKQPNGTTATWNQIVQGYNDQGASTNVTNTGLNLDNRDRFIILRDRCCNMPYQTAAGIPQGPPFDGGVGSVGAKGKGSDGGSYVEEFINLKGLETQYSGTANPATVAQISTGAIGIVCKGDVGGQYYLQWSTRLRYTD